MAPIDDVRLPGISSKEELLDKCASAVIAADRILARAKSGADRAVVEAGGHRSSNADATQNTTHGLAWLATYVEALRQMLDWARRLDTDGRFGEMEHLLTSAAFGDYLAQILGGIPMSQGEMVRLTALGVSREEIRTFDDGAVAELIEVGFNDAVKARLAAHIADHPGATTFGDTGLDETHDAMREEMHRFADAEVKPHSHEWHLANDYIPMEIIDKMSEMGVFGLTIPEDHGGLGLGKEAMCLVSEELSRGYIGVGSLGTRSEIAAELILTGGTEEQKQHWLPRIASADILPTAVFTEPGVGSDLGSLKTRAVKAGDSFTITGNKTWITHAARTDLMTLLARTDPDEKGYRGLSMFLAEKPRGTVEAPFPAEGMSGGEIEVLGYRGMKEYEIGFDGFEVSSQNLLGGEEGQGFKQLMRTFESARIQTAARAVGVAQNALEIGIAYAHERKQFGCEIYDFPRVHGKLAWATVETMIVRQLTLFSAREKDAGHRVDLEAGMAKLLAARVAWANADNSLQIHGGNGFALEYPISRILCDARILNIFEGAAEIQAQVIGRRLLE